MFIVRQRTRGYNGYSLSESLPGGNSRRDRWSGVLATAVLLAVELEWTSVAENTAGSQSTWSDTSTNQGGLRLVAQ